MDNDYSIYDSNRVNKGRKEKTCGCCGKTIHIGEPSYTISCCFSGDYEDVYSCVECFTEKGEEEVVKEYLSEDEE